MLNAAVGPGWPWQGSGVLGGIGVGVAMLALALVLPGGWWVMRRQFGARVAGPLWPLVFLEVVALGYAFVVPPWQKPDEPQHIRPCRGHAGCGRQRGRGVASVVTSRPAPARRRRA